MDTITQIWPEMTSTLSTSGGRIPASITYRLVVRHRPATDDNQLVMLHSSLDPTVSADISGSTLRCTKHVAFLICVGKATELRSHELSPYISTF